MRISHAADVTVRSCTFDSSVSDADSRNVPASMTVEYSTDIHLLDSTFNAKKLARFVLSVAASSHVQFAGNTVYGEYLHDFSSNGVIENNTFTVPQTVREWPGTVIDLNYGSANQVTGNTIDGNAVLKIGGGSLGSDDGILVTGEHDDVISRNTIGNNVFTDNDFGTSGPAPLIWPAAIATDGGGNICGSIPGTYTGVYNDYSNGYPLVCKK